MAAQSTFSVNNNGSADIAIPGQQTVLNGASNWTFSFWFKAPAVQTAASRLAEKGANTEWSISWATTTTVQVVLAGQGTVGTTGNVADNVWHHVAVTSTPPPAGTGFGITAFYLDGALVGSLNGASDVAAGDLVMCRFGGGGLFFNGYIDDVAVIAAVLSPGQIAAIAGTPGVVGSSTLNVASLSPTGLWRLETGSGLTAFDTGSGGNNGTMGATMTWAADVPAPLAAGAASASSVRSSSSSARPSTAPSVSSSASPGIIVGSVVWGQLTGAVETNKRTFAGNWVGGVISGSGNAETLTLQSGQDSIGEVVNTGGNLVRLRQNVYAAGDSITLQYRTAASVLTLTGTVWTNYAAPFQSLGFTQVRALAA